MQRWLWSIAIGTFIVLGVVGARAWALRGSGSFSQETSPQAQPDQPVYEYVGTKTCRKCHSAQHSSWEESPHAGGWEDLQPGVDAESKSRSGLDGQADYRTDARCLKCHAVGFGRPGGYTVPQAGDGRAERLAASRQGVGCEACHGPGSGFVQVMDDVNETHRQYDPQEVVEKGRGIVTQQVCLGCHNKGAVCMTAAMASDADAPWSGVDVADRGGSHAKVPLKYRSKEISGGAAKESEERSHDD